MRLGRAGAATALLAVALPSGASAAGAAPVTSTAVTSIACRSLCGAGGAVSPGGLVRLRGRGLDQAARVIFAGGPSAPAVRARGGQADARVPGGVASGPVRVALSGGAVSAPSAAVLQIGAILPRARLGAHVDARLAATRVAFDSATPAQLRYVVTDPRPVEVAVDLVRVPDGVRLAAWPAATVAPGAEQVVSWDGLAGGRVPRAGTYEFRVFVAGAPDATAPFAFAPNVFPIAGPHHLLAGAGRFGTPRDGGRTHQGQDVAAACGTPLVAARGGTVKFAGAEARAGNYLVIDADRTGWDMVYMHLRDPALVARGGHVATGQAIGFVGDTGDAEGCHLHFEQWSAPGWYTGGHPVDPRTALVSWDAPG
jgi:murein DD-endopeptidase MepM/ murein hydrolase activator NlpD